MSDRLHTLAPDAATPLCPHFVSCGGCQHQNLAYPAQLRLKQTTLLDLLHQASITGLPATTTHPSEPYAYRNRIRLRIHPLSNTLHLGYSLPNSSYSLPNSSDTLPNSPDFLPITTCPISTPILFQTAQSLLAAALTDRDAAFWLAAASELELFANHDLSRLQLTLLCAPRTKAAPGSFDRAFAAFQSHAPITLAGAGAIASDPYTGPTGRTLAAAGAPGLSYKVADETYWITRGAFFQTNRFLLETLVDLVTQHAGQPRSGTLAWDLYAGVGLFSRILARNFTRITAVEANPTAAADLRASLARLGPQHTAIEATSLDFLHRAILNRDRPSLIVLDPPRAGAGPEACTLLNRLAPATIVYVSCDPTTLARDLAILQPHYTLTALHLLDLFPQTAHLETIAILTHQP